MDFRQFILKAGTYDPAKFSKLFNALSESQFQLVPWTSTTFWDNIKNEEFAELFINEALKYLSTISTPPPQPANPKDKNIPPPPDHSAEIDSCLIAILHLVICYNTFIPESFWKAPYQQLLGSGNLSISHSMLLLNKILTAQEVNMKTILDSITNKYDSSLLLTNVPLFNLLGVLKLIHTSPLATRTLLQAMKVRLEALNNLQEADCLLHILFVIVSIYPAIDQSLLDILIEPLKSSLIFPHPVSTLGSEIGQLIQRNGEYPGSAFYDILHRIGSTNVATNGSVQVLFDHNARYFPNLMHQRYNQNLSVETQLINYGRYYLAKKQHVIVPQPLHVQRILQMIDFTKKSDAKIQKKLKLSEIPPTEPEFDTSILVPPFVNTIPMKLSIDYEVDTKLTVDGPSESKFLLIPCTEILNTTVFQPLIEFATNHDEPALINHHIAVLGDDNVLSSIIQALYLCLSKHDQALCKRLSFTIYLLPEDHSSLKFSNNVADYIASKDDAYMRFVSRVYENCISMAPKLNEDVTPIIFPSIHSEEPPENNVWFTQSNPSAIMQFALQHYLTFARFTVSLHVWSCSLQFQDDSTVQIPFVVSLHIGSQLIGSEVPGFTENDEKRIKPKRFMLMTDVDKDMSAVEVTTFAFWSINKEQNIRPSDQVLLLETVNEPGKVLITDREASSSKMSRAPVTSATVCTAEKSPYFFKVLVDNRVYNDVKNVKVEPMKHYAHSAKQMKVKIATFSPME